MLAIFALLSISASVAHTCTNPEGLSTTCRSTSLVRILAEPEALHGQWVRTTGYAVLEFEGMRLCLDEPSATTIIFENCLWLDPSPNLEPTESGSRRAGGLQKACSGRYVLVEGYVNSERHGHKGAYSASLERVERLRGHPFVVDVGERYHGCSYETRPET